MRRHPAIASLIAFMLAAIPAARADTLRCGNKLIEPGATAAEVLERCGEPTSREVIREPVRVRTPAGGTRIIGEAEKEIWRYDRRRGQFPAILTFEEGLLKELEFETD